MTMGARAKLVALLLLLLLLAPVSVPPARAEGEEEPVEEDTGFGDLLVEIGAWVAQPAGLEYFPATQLDPTNSLATSLVGHEHGTSADLRYRVGYELSKELGTVIVTWHAHRNEAEREDLRPGELVFGEIQVHPTFAGFENDGLADGYSSVAETVLRDLRIDLRRKAFESRRVRGTWSVGWRRVQHKRKMRTEYYSLLPDLPPLIPPFTESELSRIRPFPDAAEVASEFEGRGLSASLDLLVPVWRDKISLEAGMSVGVLRGKVRSSYLSFTQYYTFCPAGFSDCAPDAIVSAPYEEFLEIFDPGGGADPFPVVNQTDQETFAAGLQNENISTTSQILETYLGVRWKAWRELDVFLGFRNARFSDVGVDLVPTGGVTPEAVRVDEAGAVDHGINLQQLNEVNRSVTYEGFYGGVAYRF
jgi:hypothetical protein